MFYSGAELFVFPSLYEGFGLPPLEAMKCGIPVASSNASCLPEVLGDAAVFFDPENPLEMAEKVRSILSDAGLRRELVERGKRRTGRYSWSETAAQTLEIYGRVFSR